MSSSLNQVAVASIAGFNVVKLKSMLAENKLSTSGPKHVLASRLTSAVMEALKSAEDPGPQVEQEDAPAAASDCSEKEDAGAFGLSPPVLLSASADALPRAVPSAEAVEKQVASIPQAQRDYLVGKQLRKMGGTLEQYNLLLRAAVAELPPSDGQAEGSDRCYPTNVRSWVWKYFHLRLSTNKEVVYCNECCGDNPATIGQSGCATYQSTTQHKITHLKLRHDIKQSHHDGGTTGPMTSSAFSEPWGDDMQKKFAIEIAKWCAIDQRAPWTVSGKGFKKLMH